MHFPPARSSRALGTTVVPPWWWLHKDPAASARRCLLLIFCCFTAAAAASLPPPSPPLRRRARRSWWWPVGVAPPPPLPVHLELEPPRRSPLAQADLHAVRADDVAALWNYDLHREFCHLRTRRAPPDRGW